MWKQLIRALLFTCLFTQGFSAETSSRKANPSGIRIIPVAPTPEPDNVETKITFPKDGEVYDTIPVKVQTRLTGFPVGVYSEFDRAKEIYNDPNGQSLLVFVDNYHPIEIYTSFVDSLDLYNIYFDLILTTSIPFDLRDGMHFLRAYPARSYGESLKGPNTFASTIFYINSRENNLNIDLNAPYLTYNEPLETLVYTETRPILLDFYLMNVQLSKDGYKVKVTIDQTVDRYLTMWVPYYIYGLRRGRHTIRLQLLDENNQVVPGAFNDVTRNITIGD